MGKKNSLSDTEFVNENTSDSDADNGKIISDNTKSATSFSHDTNKTAAKHDRDLLFEKMEIYLIEKQNLWLRI